MDLLVILAVGVFFLVSMILPWVNRSRVIDLRREVNLMRTQVDIILKTSPVLSQDESFVKREEAQKAANIEPTVTPPLTEEIITKKPRTAHVPQERAPDETKKNTNLEMQFGTRLPVWIGGTALACAGFFMVKYSIDVGILSPLVRTILGFAFGCAMLGGAEYMRRKTRIANGERIAQSLSGAGIAVLYGVILAANGLYHLIPSMAAFVGMTLVTALAVILSIRHGMPIALLGLLGGFIAPALINAGDPQASKLFIYLYAVLGGLMFVIRKKGWWGLSIPAVLGAFVWVLIWLFSDHFTPTDSVWLGLFLIAVCSTVTLSSRQALARDPSLFVGRKSAIVPAMNILSISSSVFLMGFVSVQAGFGLMEWGMFGLLSLGGIALSYYNQRLYGYAPWLTMAVNAVMLVMWNTPDQNLFAYLVAAFGMLYVLSGYFLQSRSERPLLWAGLIAATSLGYYGLAYFELRNSVLVLDRPMFWGGIALALCGMTIFALQDIMRKVPPAHNQKQHLMAVYAATGTAFLSIAMTIHLQREFWSVAIALQLLAMAWINTKVDIKALRKIIGVLGCVFGFLLAPQLLLLAKLTLFGLFEVRLMESGGVPIIDWPVFQLGLPAVAFLAASFFLRRHQDGKLVQALEYGAIALIGVMGYYLTRHAFHYEENVLFTKVGFLERGVITNILFVYGVVCLWLGKKFVRQAVSKGGFVLVCVASFRVGYFDLFLHNPLWSSQNVGSWPIANALLITYGLPIVWLWGATRNLAPPNQEIWVKCSGGLMLLLSFVLLTLNVRQFFHGAFLNGSVSSNAEVYSYSVAWLLFGVALLLWGTVRENKAARAVSLAVMILTVGKVFLYDASELEGLFRVFSFLGLGLSLLALSWFYTRYVFKQTNVMET